MGRFCRDRAVRVAGARGARAASFARSIAPAFAPEALESRLCLAGATLTVPFQAANFSFQDDDFAASGDNVRSLEFAMPAGYVFDLSTVQYRPEGHGAAYAHWPQPRTYEKALPAGGTAIAFASSDAGVEIDAVYSDPDTTAAEYLAQRLAVQQVPGTTVRRGPEDATATWSIKGGGLNGKNVTLHGQRALLRQVSMADNQFQWESSYYEYVFPTGTTPRGQTAFIEAFMIVRTSVTTTHPAELPLSEASQKTLEADSVEAYDNRVLGEMEGGMKFTGAIPDLLFLYDFSGHATVAPDQLPYVGQYGQPTLPIQFGVAGGNACGPSAATMALAESGRPTPVATVYDNTMQRGLSVPPNTAQQFDWKKGRDYLQGLLAPAQGVLFKWGDNWATIESNLNHDAKVLLGTNLGEATTQGTGHVLLLLGIGGEPAVKQGLRELYPNSSGDYYIVADPAGHYFADAITGGYNVGHYGTVEALRALAKGLNYGGWFGIYPKEELRAHVDPIRTITIRPTHAAVDVRVHSPVTVVITDPMGRRTGILADGSVLNEIPDGGYQEAVGEEFGNNTRTFYPEEEKGVVLNNPAAGTYQVELVGTGSGPFHLDINTLQGGAAPTTTEYTGTASPGSVHRYSFTVGGAGTPQLQSVFANSTGWSPAFRQFMQSGGGGDGTLGYRVNAGDTLPWVNVDRLVMRFDRELPERALPAQVTVDGVRADYQAVPTALDPRSILLTFDRPLPADRLRLTDNALGGTLDFRFNVLPGDVDRSGVVVATDFSEVKKKFFKSTANPGSGDTGYTPFHDVDGSGSIVANDFSEVKKRFFNTLPGAEPTAVAAALPPRRQPAPVRRFVLV